MGVPVQHRFSAIKRIETRLVVPTKNRENKGSVKIIAKIKQVRNEAFDGDRASRKSRYGHGFYLALIQIWGEEDLGFYETFQP